MKRIKWIARNDVEVTPSVKSISTSGDEVEIWDEGRKTHYGQSRIDDQMMGAYKRLLDAENLDPRDYKAKLIARRQAAVNTIPAIRAIVKGKTVLDVNEVEVEIFDVEGSEAYEELVGNVSMYKRLLQEAQDLDEGQYKIDEVAEAQKEVDETTEIENAMKEGNLNVI